MAITTGGYDGTINEVQFATMFPRYSLLGPEDLKATTQAGDRIVSIGNGTALGPGTIDVCTNLPTIQFNAATGTRWDLVVLRRDWQPPGGLSEIKIIEGGTSQSYPAVGTAANQWNRRPGIVDDQPLYLQQVNGTLLGARIDLRAWASHGGVTAAHEMARTYLETVGAEVLVGQNRWQYVIGANSVPGWVIQGEPTEYAPLNNIPSWSTSGAITVAPEGSKRRVTVDVTVKRTGGQFTLGNDDWAIVGTIVPVGAQATKPVKYLSCAIVGGSNNYTLNVAFNPSGSLSIRSVNDFLLTTGAFFNVNVVYYI